MTPPRRIFIDIPVVLYAQGGPHPDRETCRGVLAAAAAGTLELHASTQLVQEVTFHRLRRGPAHAAVAAGRLLLDACVLYPVDSAVLAGSLDLVEAGPLRERDALHAATALEHGFAELVTTDPDFGGTPGLTTVTPQHVLAG
ncbi:MAG: type II toxin-antitoxin system VapC family toxin [Propionicimonas sp.]|nr:type II toxin-antitoxin system VapC family toxin [Propionicimonas sp.]